MKLTKYRRLLSDLHWYRERLHRDTLVLFENDERLKPMKPLVMDYINELDYIVMKSETAKFAWLFWLR